MEEIKVNEYIRTNTGYIAKVININDFREPSMKYGVEANYFKDVLFTGDENIVKHSSNIIDLIEVGDYVNGERVIDISERGLYIGYEKNVYDEYSRIFIDKDDIKSIVTKEQFAAVEYKLDN